MDYETEVRNINLDKDKHTLSIRVVFCKLKGIINGFLSGVSEIEVGSHGGYRWIGGWRSIRLLYHAQI